MDIIEKSPLNQYDIKEYSPLVFERVIQSINIEVPYSFIATISKEFSINYEELSISLSDPWEIKTILKQITIGKLDKAINKIYYTLDSNFHLKNMSFKLFKKTLSKELSELAKMDSEIISKRITIFSKLSHYHFGNIKEILLSKTLKVKNKKFIDLYSSLLEGYERILIAIKNKGMNLIDTIIAFDEINFPSEEELIKFYEKNHSLLEGKYLIDKLENISILTRLFSNSNNIDVSIFIKEVLVSWRNEYTDIIRHSKELKKIEKEEAKKKKVDFDEEQIYILFDEIIPRLLKNKSLKSILLEIKNKFTSPEEKKQLSNILIAINTLEKDFIYILRHGKPDKHFGNFNKNLFEKKPYLYLSVIYRAFTANNIDFLANILKHHEENYFLRIAARKLIFARMMMNSQIKNPVSKNRVIGIFLSSFEKMILNKEEVINTRIETLKKLSKLMINGISELGDSFDVLLGDLFVKVFTELLDVNLLNKYIRAKKLSKKELDNIELLKCGFKLYKIVSLEMSNNINKSRLLKRRNEFQLIKIERKLLSNIKKIQAYENVL